MRRDWDFVTMQDYSADMAESAAQAVHIIAQLRQRVQQLERVLAEAVLAAGGEIKVVQRNIHDPTRKIDLVVWCNEADMTLTLCAEQKTNV